MEKPLDTALVWLRRDLRADDSAALHHGLTIARRVWCVFVYDSTLLEPLPRRDRRVDFIHASVGELDDELQRLAPHGAGLLQRHGKAADEIVRLAAELKVQAVVASHDDDPAALARDAEVRRRLEQAGCAFHTRKDHVVFERAEVLTQAGQPYTVFTPYRTAWLRKLDDFYLKAYPIERHAGGLAPLPHGVAHGRIGLKTLGFEPSNLSTLELPTGASGATQLLDDFLPRIGDYKAARDYPAVKGPSYLSVHLRFGTVSIRRLAREAHARAHRAKIGEGAATWLSELCWRDFYHQVLHHFPHVDGAAFRPEYDRIRWAEGQEADALFAAWCEGRTGYPLVDAAMTQINTTGYMHNRLRMVVASFLTKDLGIDWRRGEAYFALHLNDFDLASNNGGWQWAASTGCDAQPYFRIFNPVSQSQRFDPDGRFIRRYLPQLAKLPDAAIHAPWETRPVDLAAAGVTLGKDYPEPVVDHAEARARTLERYAVVKSKAVAPSRRAGTSPPQSRN